MMISVHHFFFLFARVIAPVSLSNLWDLLPPSTLGGSVAFLDLREGSASGSCVGGGSGALEECLFLFSPWGGVYRRGIGGGSSLASDSFGISVGLSSPVGGVEVIVGNFRLLRVVGLDITCTVSISSFVGDDLYGTLRRGDDLIRLLLHDDRVSSLTFVNGRSSPRSSPVRSSCRVAPPCVVGGVPVLGGR
eukprot:GHVO01069641.1.p1 GENE.GHVO01069641.1~~GHVO01069641.1.p1  ORF type:complete len:191 (-),score=41.93 GHVO01069641.1:92-664(-)